MCTLWITQYIYIYIYIRPYIIRISETNAVVPGRWNIKFAWFLFNEYFVYTIYYIKDASKELLLLRTFQFPTIDWTISTPSIFINIVRYLRGRERFEADAEEKRTRNVYNFSCETLRVDQICLSFERTLNFRFFCLKLRFSFFFFSFLRHCQCECKRIFLTYAQLFLPRFCRLKRAREIN